MNARPRARRALACACLLLATAPAQADDAFAADRPDFVESSEVVGRGRVEIETGLGWERSQDEGGRTRVSVTPTLLRLGFNDVLEFRVETDGITRSRVIDASGSTRERGYSDASLGLKWHTQDGDEATGTPGIAWLLHVDVDSGSRAFRGQGLRPSLRAVADWELPGGLSLGLRPGVAVDKNADGKRFAAGLLAVTLGQQLAPRWFGYLQLSGEQLASRRNGGSVVTFDAGATYVVTDALELKFDLARGLTSDSPDLQWGVGLSVRF